jgi:CheY-like chemotaxis protein
MENAAYINFTWEGKTLLIVEDTNTSQRYFNVALNKTGVKLLWANNGQEAVDMVQKHQEIDLILMDIHMPVMNGIDATMAIRKLHPKIPIIIQSAFIMTGEEERSYVAGANGFMSKPIKYDTLLRTVHEYLGEKEAP